MKRYLTILMCCLLLVGCNKAEVVSESPNEVVPSSNPIRELIPVEKSTIEEVTDDTVKDEGVVIKSDKGETINTEDFEGVTLKFAKTGPVEVKFNNLEFDIGIIVDEVSDSAFVEINDNIYIYKDRVNYTKVGNNYHMYIGDEMFNETGLGLSLTEFTNMSFAIDKVTSAVKNDNIITVQGVNESYGTSDSITAMIDANTKDIIYYSLSNDTTNAHYSFSIYEDFEPTVGGTFDKVDKDQILDDIGIIQSLLKVIIDYISEGGVSTDVFSRMSDYTTPFVLDVSEFYEIDISDISELYNMLLEGHDILLIGVMRVTNYNEDYYRFVLCVDRNIIIDDTYKDNIKQEIMDYYINDQNTVLKDESSNSSFSVGTNYDERYDNTKVSGTQVMEAMSLYQGRDVAIVVQTSALASMSGYEQSAVNYGALLTKDGHTSNSDNYPMRLDSAITEPNLITTQSKTAYIVTWSEEGESEVSLSKSNDEFYVGELHNTNGLTDACYDTIGTTEIGNAAFIASDYRFSSVLIKNNAGRTIGIFFRQLKPEE